MPIYRDFQVLIAQFTQKQFHSIEGCLARPKVDAEAAFEFRRAVKRLRTVMPILNQSLKLKVAQQKPLGKILRPIYKKAGNQRDLALKMTLLEPYAKFQNTQAYREYLAKEHRRAAKLLKEAMAQKPTRMQKALKRQERLWKPLWKPKADKAALWQAFAQVLLRHIGEAVILQPSPDEEDQHQLRAELKEIFFLCKIFSKVVPIQYPTLLTDLREVCQHLGHWHDAILAYHHLGAYHQQAQLPLPKAAANGLYRHAQKHWQEAHLRLNTTTLLSRLAQQAAIWQQINETEQGG